MNKTYIIRSAAPFAAALMLSGCVDDKYDLTDIDTTSRITVNNLTVPVNLGEIALDEIIDLDDNDNISVEDGKYIISKGGPVDGEISTSDFKINAIRVVPSAITPSVISIPTPGGTVSGTQSFDVPASSKSRYDISLKDVDSSLLAVYDVKSAQPIEMKITLSVDQSLTSGDNSVSFENFGLQLPWGLTDYSVEGATGTYSKDSGILNIASIKMGSDGKGVVTFKANNIELGNKGLINASHELGISGEVGVLGGKINLNLKGVQLPNTLTIETNYTISPFDLASFSGKIDYRMDEIKIDPISLNDLPEFLNNPATKIYVHNPSIGININNPVGEYGVAGSGVLKLTSYFDGGNTTVATSDKFPIGEDGADLVLSRLFFDNGTWVDFAELGNILANDKVGGLPSSVSVAVENLAFQGDVKDFPIYHNGLGTIPGVSGYYTFTAPLGFGNNTNIIYEHTEGDWGGDVEDLHISHIGITADCHTNLPVAIDLQVLPIDREGNLIPVDEDSSRFCVPAFCEGQEVTLLVKGKNGAMIENFDGITFRAVITQNSDNGEPLGPDQYIKLNNLKIKVSGYYEKEL